MKHTVQFIYSRDLFNEAQSNIELSGRDAELHWQHNEYERCNTNCMVFLNGKNITHTAQPPLPAWHYDPGWYARHVMHIAAGHAGNPCADIPRHTFINREETAMQATYNVEKLIKALEEKKASIEEVNKSEAEFIKSKFTERVDEALAEGNTPNYGRILHEVEVEAGNTFNTVDRTGVLLIDKSIFKLKMVDADSVTLDDQEFRSLGLN